MNLRSIKARAYYPKPKRDPWAKWSAWAHRRLCCMPNDWSLRHDR